MTVTLFECHNAAVDPDDCDCYPVICRDSSVIEADFNYKADANITVDTGDGKCVALGSSSKRKCTAKDTLFT